jgi:transposase
MTEEKKKQGTQADGNSTKFIRKARQKSRKKFSAEDKIRIVIDGLRGESPVVELCRREGIHANVYYKWLKEFMEAGKARLAGDTIRSATREEVKQIKQENNRLKELLAELYIENQALKKTYTWGLAFDEERSP